LTKIRLVAAVFFTLPLVKDWPTIRELESASYSYGELTRNYFLRYPSYGIVLKSRCDIGCREDRDNLDLNTTECEGYGTCLEFTLGHHGVQRPCCASYAVRQMNGSFSEA
jgi:hypothetical protein